MRRENEIDFVSAGHRLMELDKPTLVRLALFRSIPKTTVHHNRHWFDIKEFENAIDEATEHERSADQDWIEENS